MELMQIISRCKQKDRRAQNMLFNSYAPLFKSICLRYMKNEVDAEDALIKGFYKIFKNLHSFKGEGSLEGWMKRIVVNECLMLLRKNHNINMMVAIDDASVMNSLKVDFVDNLTYKEVLALLDELPVGYRTVFNMYVIEGYKHREIGEKLGISINTSKSQLILAKKKLQQLVKKKLKIKSA